MSESHDQVVPRKVLVAAAIVAVGTIAFAAYGSITGLNLAKEPTSTVAKSIVLRFEPRPNGRVAVIDHGDGDVIKVLESGKDGFIMGALRGLNRARTLRNMPKEKPYRLTLLENGRLQLSDTVADQSIYLEAYGPTNRKAFEQLLVAGLKN